MKTLWRAIEAFDIDGGPAALTFEARLARENNWTRQFAARVVLEYKKFLYLTVNAGHPVTPSDEVDQAWHLHMTYTRSYWDRLCGEVLKQPLHHEPTRGGKKEGDKFEDWYLKTRQSYRRQFGEDPPTDIWPDAATRFGEAPHYQRINVRRYWMIPRPRCTKRHLAGGAAAVAATAALAGCIANVGQNSAVNGMFVLAVILILFILIGIAIAASKTGRPSGCTASGCSGPSWFVGSHGGSSGSDGHGHGGHSGHGDSGGHTSDGGSGGSDAGTGSSGCGSSGCSSSGCGSSGCSSGCGGGGCSS